jgi:serine/threonine protein kinase/tetratricopeptide (TPR) repeat protein
MTTPSLPKRYKIRSLLGEGGSGRVYRVQDSIRDRELALKLVTPAEAAFLRREFDTLRQIRHEDLIQVFDWGALPSGEAYYTMELMEGGDWAGRMGKPQHADEVRHVLAGLLRGLAHLHCHGEIHGDLKPGNILLGAGGVVKITDTGMGGSEGRGSGSSGTPGYTAPEVWEGSPSNVRSDLYAVGVMGYEALTGKHPFEKRTVREVVSGQLEGWVAAPGAHGVQVPADLERVVMRATERNPGLRQGNADEFMEGFGVEDRIGEILGGKLVGHEKEIDEVEKLLSSDQPGTPTLLYLVGEPGIGKGALIEEVVARTLGAGGRALEIDSSAGKPISNQISDLLGASSHAEPSADSAQDLQMMLWKCGQSGPVLLHVRGTPDRASRNAYAVLARYLWALSFEHSRASHVLIALGSPTGPEREESFVRTIRLAPLSEPDCDQLVTKTLGVTNFQPELVAKLQSLSGGNPGVLRSTLVSLVERGLLQRRDGVWTFREITQVRSLAMESRRNPWVVTWRHLDPTEQRMVLTLTVFRRPISTEQLRALLPGRNVESPLSALQAKGWIRKIRDEWAPASESVRQAAQELASKETQSEIADSILRTMPAEEHAEERADLQIRYRPSPQALDSGLDSVRKAVSRGDHALAIDRLKICLQIAEDAGLQKRSREICLRLAALAHQLGDEEGALSYLGREKAWEGDNDSLGPDDSAQREYMLGQVAMSRGSLEAARTHLTHAIERANKAGNMPLLLRCHADLAEIDWRHGDAASRTRAIDRVREVLDQHPEDPSLRNERAALMYELGAAMIVGGASRDSIEILRAGSELAESDYWKMRLATAMSTALHYIGDPAGVLEWLDRAWRYAEASHSDSFKARILSNRGSWHVNQGQFAQAADQNRLSAAWARRFGSTFEYAAGSAGSAMCSIHIARYEDALVDAREVMGAAQALNNYTYVAKAFEIEGLANYFLGRTDAAESEVRKALEFLNRHGYTVVKPRLEWLLARVLRRRGEIEESESVLLQAEAQLLETRDPEDLWGVQVEIHTVRSMNGNANSSIAEIETLFRGAEQKGLVLIAVPAALAVSEILHEHGLDYTKYRDLLTVGLERAESSGMREFAWQLSYRMGVLAARVGQRKESQSRFTLASRVIRQIAGDLSDQNRQSYLGSAHVVSAIRSMDELLLG